MVLDPKNEDEITKEEQYKEGNTNQTRSLDRDIDEFAPSEDDIFDDEPTIIPWVIEFRIIGTPAVLRIPIQEEMLIGRLDAKNGVFPDIDMNNYNGQHMGVSRRHARLRAKDNRITIEDLGSSNGTFINNKMLIMKQPYRIREGDKITFGKLELQIHFLVKPSVDDDTMVGLGNHLKIPRVAQDQHLIIVDDNPDVCHIVDYVARRCGYRVTLAHTMTEAIARLDSEAVDGLILELILPDGSGLDIVHYVRRKNPHMPILATASTSGGFTMGKALEEGVNIFITKPIAVDELIQGLGKMAQLFAKQS